MSAPPRPYSPACERNREPILAVLRDVFAGCTQVLEVGSGTGQHALHFAQTMPWLRWQCSDRVDCIDGLRLWLQDAAHSNLPPPLALDVAHGPWPRAACADGGFDAVFSANTLHIMGWHEVQCFFAGVAQVLAPGGVLAVYGPFTVDGQHISDSNRDFDASLRARDARMGVRDRAAVDALAHRHRLQATRWVAMPANNQLLCWRLTPSPRASVPA